MLQRRISVAQIAVQLGRHRSMIQRNFWNDPDVPMATGYCKLNARHLADLRRKRQAKLLQDDDLRGGVIAGLEAGWSPQQIAGRMRHDGARRRGCHGAIYRYVHSPKGRAQALARYNPEQRRKRKARDARKPGCLVFSERCMIRNRLQAVRDRQVCGQWEVALMVVTKEHGPSNVAMVERRIGRYPAIFRDNDLWFETLTDNLITFHSPRATAGLSQTRLHRNLPRQSTRRIAK